ncbi:MAG TPA: hypothetical protein VI072_08165 [Polyangiaceae bacterium]
MTLELGERGEATSEPSGVAGAGRTQQLGIGLMLGTLAALLATLPAVLRFSMVLSGSHVSLVGLTAAWLAPAVVAARILRPAPSPLITVSCALLLCFGPLTLFAGKLWAATHHRPLGAVTFSIVATGLLLGSVAVVARLRSVGPRASAEPRRVTRALLGIACAASLALGFSRLPGALSDPTFRAGLLDFTLLVVLGVAATRWDVSAALNRTLRVVGPAAYTVVVATGAVLLRYSVDYAVLQAEAPVPLAPLLWL